MRSANRSVSGHFDQVADSWVHRYAEHPSFRHRLDIVGRVVREVVATHDDPTVLDFGGGAAIFSLIASEGAAAVLCLDVSVAMVQAGVTHEADAIMLLRGAGHDPAAQRVRRMVGPLDAVGGRVVGMFDVILAVAVLEYLEDPATTLHALATRLRPGGDLIITVPNTRSWYRKAETAAGALGAQLGMKLRMERLRSRAYTTTRPHGNDVDWQPGARAGGLMLERTLPLALSAKGVLAHVRATQLIVLRKPLGADPTSTAAG